MDLAALGRQATALHQQGRLGEAEPLYRQILAANPSVYPALYLLGALRLQLGDSADAASLLQRALAQNPGDPAANVQYGMALQSLMRYPEALAAHERALAAQPGNIAARMGRGAALRALERDTEALADHEAVLTADGSNVDAWNGRGALLRKLGRVDEALDSLNRALALAPDFAEALHNRGELLWNDKADFTAALADLERALVLAPDRPHLADNLRHVKILQALFYCDWPAAAAIRAALPGWIAAGEIVPPFLTLLLCDDPHLSKAAAQNVIARRFPAKPPMATGRYNHDRPRIAYISSDLGDHPVGAQIVQMIENHDHERFEIIAISTGKRDGSALRRRLAQAFQQFHDVQGRKPAQIAQLVRDLEVDVLVDLNGHTQNDNLETMSHRPAPVQALWLGYAGTSAAPFVDYVISDRLTSPDAIDFTEKLVYLPDSFFVTDTSRVIGTAPTRTEAGLPTDGFVFCSFNLNTKITEDVFAVWMRLLAQVPGSVLWLKEPGTVPRAVLTKAAEAAGIDPARLVFAGRVEIDVHLARHALADLFLDSLPYNAHATACDALWAGLPVLTCRGRAFPGRVSASLLHAVGLPELVTDTLEDYETLALALARDPARLKALRDKLAANRAIAPLFDTQRFARNLEAAYLAMLNG